VGSLPVGVVLMQDTEKIFGLLAHQALAVILAALDEPTRCLESVVVIGHGLPPALVW